MTQKASLDLKGTISVFPVPEVVLEITKAGLSGSLRVSHEDRKTVIYFSEGDPVYAVSNQRSFRLSEALSSQGIVDRGFILENRDISNDLQLADRLVARNVLSKEVVDEMVAGLCGSVISAVLRWNEGEWVFSPHARSRADLVYNIDHKAILREYALSVSATVDLADRFKTVNEWIELDSFGLNDYDLAPHEVFLLSRLESGPLTLKQLTALSGQDPDDALRSVYILWLSGCVKRTGRNAVFSDDRVSYLTSAKLKLKKAARSAAPVAATTTVVTDREEIDRNDVPVATTELDLEETLNRIEKADDYYTVLGLAPSAKVPEIRNAYYRLAKLLHPDRHRKQDPELLLRIEKAFTEIAQAHETLRTPEGRQSYDVRMRKEQRDRENEIETGGDGSLQSDQAAQAFERGMALQLEGEFEASVQYFARAAHYSPQNARYHAHYGKALSMDEDQRHKAEKELVTAVRLEPENPSHRLMLAEFFIRYRLIKRAEGELSRLLEMSPGNKQAQAMLDSLGNK